MHNINKKILTIVLSGMVMANQLPIEALSIQKEPIKKTSLKTQTDNILTLGKYIIDRNKVTFPDAYTTFDDKAGLKIEYLDEDADVTTEYEVNSKNVSSKDKVIIIEEYDNATVNDILKSLKITSSKKVDIKVSLIKNNSNYMPLGTVATASSYQNNTPDKAIDDNTETYWGAPDYEGKLNLKFKETNSINKVQLKVGVSPTAKNTYIIKANGMVIGQKTLIVEQANLTTVDIDVVNGNYGEIEIECKSEGIEGSYSPNGSWISISEIRLSGLSEELDTVTSTIDNIENSLNMGEMQYEDEKITFNNSSAKISGKTNLIFNMDMNNIKIKYTLDGNEIIKTGSTIEIQDLTQDNLDEVLKSLSVLYNKYDGCGFSITLKGSPDITTKKYQIYPLSEKPHISLGDYIIEGGKVVFPEAKGVLCKQSILNISSPQGTKFSYTLNGESFVKTQTSLDIELNTQEELDEFLESLVCTFNNIDSNQLVFNLKEKPFVPYGSSSDTSILNGVWNCSAGYYGDKVAKINFKNPQYVSNVSLNFYPCSSTPSNVQNRGVIIKGQKIDGTWAEIGRGGTYNGQCIIPVKQDKYLNISVTYNNNEIWYKLQNIGYFKVFNESTNRINIKTGVDLTVSVSDDLKSVSVNFNNKNAEASHYKVYKKEESEKDWKIIKDTSIKSLRAAYKENIGVSDEFIDTDVKDTSGPKKVEINTVLNGLKKGIKLVSEDIGTQYKYYTSVFDKNNNRLAVSDIKTVDIKSGLKGYCYEISNSSIPMNVLSGDVNSKDDFISAKELVDKSYLHVVAIDEAGNKSEVTTIPILGIFTDESPELDIGGNISISEGNDLIDLMEGVSALDDYDGDLTSKVTYKITTPNGEIVSDFDTNILGKWIIVYSVEDTHGNVTTKERVIKVVKDLSCYSVEFGKPLITSTFVEFPNSKIIKYGEIYKKINGIKLYFKEGFNDSISIHYTDKGIKKTSREQQVLLDSVYTKEEAEELIKSIKIEHDNSSDFTFNVRLSNSDAEDIVYNYENGHYYKFIDAPAITWKDAKKEAEKQEFLGHKGHLAVIKSEQEQTVVNSLTKKNTWLGATDEVVEGDWIDVEGKPIKWTNWASGEPNNVANKEHYLMMLSSSGGKWNDTINECWIIEGFLVEYGGDNPLPTPDTLDDFNYDTSIQISKLVPKKDIILEVTEDKNKNESLLSWNNIKDINYYNVIKNDVTVSSNQKENYFEDESGKDISAPTTPTHKIYDSGIKQGIKFNSNDTGSTYSYKIEGISNYGDITHVSDIKNLEIKTGLKGFSYEVTDNSIPSSDLGSLINSEDGFIAAKELLDKSYVHIVAVDKANNKSEIVTLPILGMFIDCAPILTIGGDISIKQETEYDIMNGIIAKDDYDGDVTKDIKAIVKNPSNEIVEKLDTNIIGKWTIEYSVKDSKNQETKAIKYITITENLDYLNIKLGEPNKARFNVAFPNALVTNSKDTTIDGIKFYISNGYNSSMAINYEEKGVKKSTKTQQVLLKDKYTTEEANNIVKSIRIEHNNSNDFDFSVRLQSNIEFEENNNKLFNVVNRDNKGNSLSYEDTVHIEKMIAKQDLVLNTKNGDKNNKIKLAWNKLKDVDNYKIYRRTIGTSDFELEETITENDFESSLGIDITSPNIDYTLQYNKEMEAELQFYSEDEGTEYEYKIEGYDKDNYQIAYSNVSKAKIISEFEGYSYIVDESPSTDIDGKINNTNGKFKIKATDKTYLHICAVDSEGNKTQTKHIKLADSTHNNKPQIITSKNKVISIGETLDKLKDVKAYDLEDGDLTYKLTVEGEIDNKVMGVYELKYTVEDSKGLRAEETVKVHVKGDMKLDIEEFSDKLIVSWNKVENASKYRVYKTDMNGYNLEEIGIFNTLTYKDIEAKDTSSPVISYIGEQEAQELDGKEKIITVARSVIKATIKDEEEKEYKLNLKTRDLASTYRYFVEALNDDDKVINSSEVGHGSVMVGLAGYSYLIDDEKDTEVQDFVNAESVEDIDISKSKSKILHIKPIDKNGNVGETVHYLIGGKYDTNFIPVINGLDTIRIHEGDTTTDLMKGITAYDYEDGDITDKIEIKNKLDVNKNGKQILIYTVEDSNGNIREAKRNVLIDGDMNIKVTPNKEDNNVRISWDKNILGDEVYYEVRKYDKEIDSYKTIAYTEELNFIDKDAKDIYGPKVYDVHGSDMDTDILEDEITLNINAVDRGVSVKYQVRTRLKEDNLIIRDMTDEEGNDWGIGGAFNSVVKYYKWKLSDKREDTLENVALSTTISPNEIVFEHNEYKYIHFVPFDEYGNIGQVVHYQIGRLPLVDGGNQGGNEGDEGEEDNNGEIVKLTPPKLEGVNDKFIILEDKFKVLDGVTAKSYNGEDLTDFIKVEGRVNRYKVGEYKLLYSITDFKGQTTEKERTIKVIDYDEEIPSNIPDEIKETPDIYFKEEDYIHVGESYSESRILEDIKVIDKEDGDITSKVTYETNLDIDRIGSYEINYSVRDSDDNVVMFTRIVNVIEKDAEIPNIPSNGDNENNGEDNEDEIKDSDYTKLKVSDKYITIGSHFNAREDIYAYDSKDGNIEDKVKVSGFVNTLKKGTYNLTYKVTNSKNRTTVKGIKVFVKEGKWENGNGELPNPNPDWGNNDNENGSGNHVPNKPNKPNQGEDGFNPDEKPDIDKDINNDGQDDIFIDKDGNIIKPGGEIETPGGIIIKPGEDGKKPEINDEGNIVVPPGGIVIFPNGTEKVYINGAILKPDGTIIVEQSEDDIDNIQDTSSDNDNLVEETKITSVEVENENRNSIKESSPKTGDNGIGSMIILAFSSLTALFVSNKKKKK
ncbi:TPA: DUF5011 domain-containing protein [Clostridioides difficile]|nr:DUF5011 domain-containing protein [Clostridioides difficile]